METKRDMKIVIVEDDNYYNRALTRYVHSICNPSYYPDFNFEISSYTSAHECLENYELDTNVMILDYLLTNKNSSESLTGEDILKEVKKANPDCKFIIVTEQQNPNVTQKLIAAGITEYIDKDLSDRNRLGLVLLKLLNQEYQKINQYKH